MAPTVNKTKKGNHNPTPDSIAVCRDLPMLLAQQEPWYKEGLVIVVIGASGDLAKKKTYPALFQLWSSGLLPSNTLVWGYARTKKSHDELRHHLAPALPQAAKHADDLQDFLSRCFYHSGSSYGDRHAYQEMMEQIQLQQSHDSAFLRVSNFLFYLAIPPDVFGETATTIRHVLDDAGNSSALVGWTRLVVEKPFGRDLLSCQELLQTLAQHFHEDQLYRIDHYLGKEIVQNLPVLRMANQWIDPFFHKSTVQSVLITFQEPFGTEGRGGYFDPYGIIRDIIQNHLLQVLTLVAMEIPSNLDNINSHIKSNDDGTAIRDAKVQVLRSMPPIVLEDTLLGQYEGYADDPTIANPDTRCPTYAAVRCWVDNERWQGVPFILEAGKALNQRLCEVRIQLKQSPVQRKATSSVPNELILRIQPDPGMYLTTHIKAPGFSNHTSTASLAMKYQDLDRDSADAANVDAYTRLLLDVFRGRAHHFVRDDELVHSWQIFTPLLHRMDLDDRIQPVQYPYGSPGPMERIEFLARMQEDATVSDASYHHDELVSCRGLRQSAL